MPCDTTQRAWWCTWEGSTNPQNTSTADTSTSRIHSAPKIYQCVICRTKLCTRVLFIVCIFCTEIKQRKKKPNTSVRFTYIHTKTTGYRMTNNESYRLKTHLLFIAKKQAKLFIFAMWIQHQHASFCSMGIFQFSCLLANFSAQRTTSS